MELVEYTAEDPALEGARRVLNACREADTPWHPRLTAYRWEMEVRHGWDGSPVRHWLGSVDGRPVASLEIELGEWDNLDLAWLYLYVDPQHRRAGHGSEALAFATELARSLGRTKIGAGGWDLPPVLPFAQRHGFELGSVEVYRRLLLDAEAGELAEDALAVAGPHAADYELVRLEGCTPEELLEEVAEMSASINDAPLDELDMEDEAFPPERIRAYEQAMVKGGYRLHRLLARHRRTGQLAGHTVVAVDVERPELGHQHDTTVVRAHRGHRLGLLLKGEMQRRLLEEEPRLETLDTWNAESNDHMIAINEALGYRALARALELQRRL